MPYNVRYTETNNTSKATIVVSDETINTSTSLTFVGKNYANYGSYIAENFLHLMENFANTTSPVNPVQGQLWFDNNSNQLMVNNDGTSSNWTPVGSVQKSVAKPTVANIGDIWVDTVNQQLSIYTGSGTSWTLIGPLLSQGTVTGQQLESIDDNNNVKHNIISLYSSNDRISIISTDSFIPKVAMPGFSNGIFAGITLNSTIGKSYKFTGTATNADSLGGISSAKFLRNDIVNTTSGAINVPALNVGNDNNLTISSDSALSTNYLISAPSEKSIEVRVNQQSVAYFDPLQRVGIATTNPASTLDVNGKITISSTSGMIQVNGTSETSIQTAGGLSVTKSAIIGKNLTITNGTIILNYIDDTQNPVVPINGPVIMPGYQTHTLVSGTTYTETNPALYDIGSATYRFRNLYVTNFVGDVRGNVTGTVTGDVNGSVSGTANSLKNTTVFELVGDITSNTIEFKGAGGTASFETTLSQSAVSSKKQIYDTHVNDELLIYRQNAVYASGYISNTTLYINNVIYGEITANMSVMNADTTPIPVGMFIIGTLYTIIEFNSTTNIQWNTIAGTTNYTYTVGSTFTAADTGAGLGDGTAYVGNNTILNTTILSGSGNTWTVDVSQTVGSIGSPVTLYIGTTNLYRTTKQTFIDAIPTIQIGSIILYPGTLPQGYLICDGTQYFISDYPDLYNVLGSTYNGESGMFYVPSLTGPTAPIAGINYIIYSGI